jgi:hypothetical protein
MSPSGVRRGVDFPATYQRPSTAGNRLPSFAKSGYLSRVSRAVTINDIAALTGVPTARHSVRLPTHLTVRESTGQAP